MAQQIKTKFIQDAAITDAKVATGVDAVKLANGSVSNTEFQYLDGVTSSIQTQLNAKASTAYVDAAINGLDWKQSVRAATTAAGTLASSFENGDVIDGVTLATGDRILIKNQASGAENGIYTVNVSGAPTRSTDADADAEVTAGLAVFVEEGSLNGDSGWVLSTDNTITLGTTALVFAQFTGTGSITAGAGLTKTGNTIDVVSGDTSLTVNADELHVNLNTTGGLETSSGVRIKSDVTTANTIGITTTANGAGVKFDSNSFVDSGSETLALAAGVAGSGLALTSGILSVNVDDSTIEINSDTLRVKDLGITNAKIANATIDLTTKVTGVLPIANGGVGIWFKESITLSGTDITNQYVELSHPAVVKSIVAFVGRLALHETEDYTTSVVVTNTRLTFTGSIATAGLEALVAGDKLFFTYTY